MKKPAQKPSQKANPLMSGLAEFDRKAAPRSKAPVAAASPKDGRPPSRQGTVQVAAFFPADVRTQLKITAAEQRRDVQDLLAEAINLIFVKYGKPEIAPQKTRQSA